VFLTYKALIKTIKMVLGKGKSSLPEVGMLCIILQDWALAKVRTSVLKIEIFHALLHYLKFTLKGKLDFKLVPFPPPPTSCPFQRQKQKK
jgi:hypothetical protein